MVSSAGTQTRGARRFDWPALFGYDFFISFKLGAYEQGGSQSYASYLARALRERDLEVFFSEDEAPPGGELNATLVAALRRSRVLVVVANETALSSPWVRLEVECYRRVHPQRPIVAIDIEHAIQRAAAGPDGGWIRLEERIRLDERDAALRDGMAGEALVARVALAANALSARRRLRLALGATLLVLAAITGYAVQSALEAQRQTTLAQQRLAEAERERAAAQRQKERADHERDLALARLRDASARRLAAQSLEMLAATRPGGDERALLQLIAAWRLAPVSEVAAALQRGLQLREPLRTLWSPQAPVTRLAFDPADPDRLVAIGDAGLRVLDLRRRAPPHTVPAEQALDQLAFSPDGRRFVTGDRAGRLQRWDATRLEPDGAPWLAHPGGVHALVFSADGRTLASAGADGRIRLWQAATAEPLGVALDGGSAAKLARLAFSPDGTRLAAAGAAGALQLWTVAPAARIALPRWPPQEQRLRGLAFTPDGRRLAAGGLQSVLVLDAADGAPIRELAGASDTSDLAIGRQGLLATVHIDGRLMLWAGSTGRQIRPARGQSVVAATTLAFSADGRRIAVGSAEGLLDVWDVDPAPAPQDPVEALAFLADGTRVITAGDDRRAVIRDARSGQPVGAALVGHGAPLRSIAVDARAGLIVTAANDACIRVWDAASGAPLGTPLCGHRGWIGAIALFPDGRRLVSAGDDGTLRRWDLAQRAALGAPLESGGGPVRSVAVSPDGRRLASGHDDGSLRLWDADSGALLGRASNAHGGGVNGVAFSSDGRQLATVGMDSLVRRWRAADAGVLGAPLRGHGASVKGVAYSPDGRFIASSGDDGQLRLWDAASGLAFGAPLDGGWSYASNIAFRGDGRAVLAGGLKGGWRVVPVLDGWADTLCDKLAREPSAGEWLDWVGPGIDPVPLCPRTPR